MLSKLRFMPFYRFIVVFFGLGPVLVNFIRLDRRRKEMEKGKFRAKESRAHNIAAKRIRVISAHLEGLYIKGAQVLGGRGDLVPEAYARELGGFHDRVRPHPFASVQPAIEDAFGGPVEEVFATFDKEPVASASLAQVHRATLKDGTLVAVKVQYPEVDKLVKADTRNMMIIAKIVGRFFDFNGVPFVEEMNRQLHMELDFEHEAEALKKVGKIFADDDRIALPSPIEGMASKRVLVMTWMDGVALSKSGVVADAGIDRDAMAKTLGQIYGRMIFREGFFHGDPHPGNVLITPDHKLGLLDFGLSQELPPGFGPALGRFFAAAMSNDLDTMLTAGAEAGFVIRKEMAKPLAEGLRMYLSGDLAEKASKGELDPPPTPDEMAILDAPPHITLVMRALMLLNGLSSRLVPGGKVVETAMMTELMTAVAKENAAKAKAAEAANS